MDEIPLTLNCPANKAVHFKGDNTVSIITAGNEKISFMSVLACTANGQKLKPLLIFNRKMHPKDNFTNDVVITINEKGWIGFHITCCFHRGFKKKIIYLIVQFNRFHII